MSGMPTRSDSHWWKIRALASICSTDYILLNKSRSYSTKFCWQYYWWHMYVHQRFGLQLALQGCHRGSCHAASVDTELPAQQQPTVSKTVAQPHGCAWSMPYGFQFVRSWNRTELSLISSNSEVAAVISSKDKIRWEKIWCCPLNHHYPLHRAHSHPFANPLVAENQQWRSYKPSGSLYKPK